MFVSETGDITPWNVVIGHTGTYTPKACSKFIQDLCSCFPKKKANMQFNYKIKNGSTI